MQVTITITVDSKDEDINLISSSGKQKLVDNSCWVTFYEDQDFKGKSITLYGPAEHRNLKSLPGANGYDWGDKFDSVRTGPGAWVVTFNDEDFEDDSYMYGPGSEHRQLAKGDDVDSLRIYNSNPQP